MREHKIFYINGKRMDLPVFEKDDRVTIPDKQSLTTEPVLGTVESTREGGLFVSVKWDKDKYQSITGGTVEFGQGRMVNGIVLVSE